MFDTPGLDYGVPYILSCVFLYYIERIANDNSLLIST